MYYLMISYKSTREEAEKKFASIFERESDTVIQDHNYWFLGQITEEELALHKKRNKNFRIIEDRDMP